MKKIILFLVLLLTFIPTTIKAEDTPHNGNIWIITVPFCTDLDTLIRQASDYCGVYRQIPIDISYKLGCLKWFIGIAGPYAVPGAYDLQFRCY